MVFKLKGNLLFYYKVHDLHQPIGLYVMEDFIIQTEESASIPFCFSIVFNGNPDKKYYFSAPSQMASDEWVKLLKNASIEGLRQELNELNKQLMDLIGSNSSSLLNYPHVLKL